MFVKVKENKRTKYPVNFDGSINVVAIDYTTKEYVQFLIYDYNIKSWRLVPANDFEPIEE